MVGFTGLVLSSGLFILGNGPLPAILRPIWGTNFRHARVFPRKLATKLLALTGHSIFIILIFIVLYYCIIVLLPFFAFLKGPAHHIIIGEGYIMYKGLEMSS